MTKAYEQPPPPVVPAVTAKPDRPFALKVVCAVLFLNGLVLALVGGLLIYSLTNPSGTLVDPREIDGLLSGFGIMAKIVVTLVFAVGIIWVATMLWRLQPWAWRRAMLVMGLLLVLQIWTYLNHSETIFTTLGLALDVIAVYYLIQADVRRLFIDPPKADGGASLL